MMYWDYAAAAPPLAEVGDTMAQVMHAHFANPSALHRPGREAARLVGKAREVCAAALGAAPEEIHFTSGATESNNWAIKGAAMQYASRGRHLVTTEIEHPSVYESFLQLRQAGWEVTFVPPGPDGIVDPARIEAAVRKDTVLVSVMHVNNETGAVQPLQEIGFRVKRANRLTLLHVDGVQGFGRVAGLPADWQADLYSLSAHKLGGPRGAGLLVIRKGITLMPLLAGGGQEQGGRAGTENVAALVAAAKAVRISAEKREETAARTGAVRSTLIHFLKGIPEFSVTSPLHGAPHIVHFTYPGMKGEVMARALEERGMIVGTRSSCSSRAADPSRVLLSMGMDARQAQGAVRISFGAAHTTEDAEALSQALLGALQDIKIAEGGIDR